MNLLTPETMQRLRGRMDDLELVTGSCRLVVENVMAATIDGEDWVVLDNLRRLPEALDRVHRASGRLLATLDAAEDEASHRHVTGDRS